MVRHIFMLAVVAAAVAVVAATPGHAIQEVVAVWRVWRRLVLGLWWGCWAECGAALRLLLHKFGTQDSQWPSVGCIQTVLTFKLRQNRAVEGCNAANQPEQLDPSVPTAARP